MAGLFLSVPIWAASIPTAIPQLCAEDIVMKMLQADAVRDRALHRYSATRHYVIHGEKNRMAEMTVRLVYHDGAGKTFEVLAQNGSEGVYRRVFEKVLQAESETSRGVNHEDSSISPKNYNFQLLGEEPRDGRRCYVVRLLPKRKSKYLIDGKGWIDEQDYALVRLEGRTSGSVSFWVGRPYIVQTFRKIGNYWLASRNDSIANVKIMGRTELTIDSSDYSVPGVSDVELAAGEHVTAPAAVD